MRCYVETQGWLASLPEHERPHTPAGLAVDFAVGNVVDGRKLTLHDAGVRTAHVTEAQLLEELGASGDFRPEQFVSSLANLESRELMRPTSGKAKTRPGSAPPALRPSPCAVAVVGAAFPVGDLWSPQLVKLLRRGRSRTARCARRCP